MPRPCSACNRFLDRESFSNNQWSKGAGSSRCHSCVHGSAPPSKKRDSSPIAPPPAKRPTRPPTARLNDASHATFKHWDLDNPFAEGTFRWVAEGTYTNGARSGEKCVCKWFKRGATFGKEFFEMDIKAVDEAIRIVDRFNDARIVGKPVRVNKPEVWTFTEGSIRSGEKVLQEPFIINWQKFNSNTGWNTDDTPWARVMQALSHFSYHASGGQLLLCDVQGGVYSDGVVLTDPVVQSQNRKYGVTDLGPRGISSFFSQHQCNEFCSHHWKKPVDEQSYHRPIQGTSMMSTKPIDTLYGRPAMTGW